MYPEDTEKEAYSASKEYINNMYLEDTEKEEDEEEDIVGGIHWSEIHWVWKILLLIPVLIGVGLVGFIIWGIYKIITI